MNKIFNTLFFLSILFGGLFIGLLYNNEFETSNSMICIINNMLLENYNEIVEIVVESHDSALLIIVPEFDEECSLQYFYLINNINKYYSNWSGGIVVFKNKSNLISLNNNMDNVFIEYNVLETLIKNINSSVYIVFDNREIAFMHIDYLYGNEEFDSIVHQFIVSKYGI